MLDWFASPQITRIVADGRVRCPVRAADTDVERCVGCAFLHAARQEDGAFTEIVCRPRLSALVAAAEDRFA